MFRKIAVFALILAAATALGAQTPALRFDAISIKASPDLMLTIQSGGKPHVGTKTDGGRVDIGFASLSQLICTAYDVKEYQLVGPDWLKSQHFDIVATMPAGATEAQVPAMLQTMLADRFHLTAHRDDKDEPVYAMVVGPGGSKLKPAPAPEAADAAAASPDKGQSLDTPMGKMTVQQAGPDSAVITSKGSPFGAMKMTMSDGRMRMEADSMSMKDLAETLTPMVDMPVVNKTGLAGRYQVALEFSMEAMMAMAQKQAAAAGLGNMMQGMPAPAVATDPGSGGAVVASIEALGLKLDKSKAAIGQVIVDHMDKVPTEN